MNSKNNVSWLDNAVFYEIYPQSFRDTNSDGVGDINGIIEKLDYIKELGCNAIWINPCFLSPFGDAGYDVQDYCTVAPRYGTNEDLVRLFGEVHRRDMHVILDLVPGHTSSQHEWFRKSSEPQHNEFSDRYIWSNSIWEDTGSLPCLRGMSQRDGSAALNFFSMQPALNYGYYKPERPWQQPMDAPGPLATREAMKDVMRFWLSAGCDGFRVDMAGSLVKNDPEGKGTVALWQDFRAFLDAEFPNAAMVSEWGEPDKSLLGGFHMDFLLHFGPSHYNDLFRCAKPYFSKKGKGSAAEFIAKYKENYEKTDGKGLICIPSGNHDMDRLARNLDNDEIRTAFAFLLTMPGAPFIYYGDELGMKFVEGLTSVEGGYGRTGSRSPMQWNDGLNAGFSSASAEKLYIPVHDEYKTINAQAEMADEKSVYSEVKRLIAVRQANPALRSRGSITWLSDGYPMSYIREGEGQRVMVVINPSAQSEFVECAAKKVLYAIGDVEVNGGTAVMGGCSALIAEI